MRRPNRASLLQTSINSYIFFRLSFLLHLLQRWDLDVYRNVKRPAYWLQCNKVHKIVATSGLWPPNWTINRDYWRPFCVPTWTRANLHVTKLHRCVNVHVIVHPIRCQLWWVLIRIDLLLYLLLCRVWNASIDSVNNFVRRRLKSKTANGRTAKDIKNW